MKGTVSTDLLVIGLNFSEVTGCMTSVTSHIGVIKIPTRQIVRELTLGLEEVGRSNDGVRDGKL